MYVSRHEHFTNHDFTISLNRLYPACWLRLLSTNYCKNINERTENNKCYINLNTLYEKNHTFKYFLRES